MMPLLLFSAITPFYAIRLSLTKWPLRHGFIFLSPLRHAIFDISVIRFVSLAITFIIIVSLDTLISLMRHH